MAGWIVLLTERFAEPGKVRVLAHAGEGRTTHDLRRAEVYHSARAALFEVHREPVARKLARYTATVAEAEGAGISPLPGGESATKRAGEGYGTTDNKVSE